MAKKKGKKYDQGHWIEEIFSKPGAKGGLHRTTHTKPGEKISKKKLAKAKARGGKAAKQVIAAENMAKARRG